VIHLIKNKVFLFGLDNSGKTSIVNAIKKEPEPGKTKPTIAFNINSIILKATEFVIWDAPGQVLYRDKWKRGMLEAEILCFILDTADLERFDEAKEELNKILENPENRNLPLVICFHKMDLDDAKKNLPTARGMFQLPPFDERKLYKLETSIYIDETIEALKDKFIEIIEQSRW